MRGGQVPAAAFAGLILVACGSPVATTHDEPLSRTVLQDGIAVSLALERATTRPGDPLRVIVTVRNVGIAPVIWRGNGCALSSPIAVIAAENPEPPPVRGDDVRAAIVADLAADAERPAGVVPVASRALDIATSCAVDHGFSELAPGAVIRFVGSWSARTVIGAPVAPGEYAVHAAFPLLRSNVPLVPAGYRAERDGEPILVDLPIAVNAGGLHSSGLRAAAAVDRLLSHPDLAVFVRDRAVWASAHLEYRDGEWGLRLRIDPAHVLVARLADSPNATPLARVEMAASP